MLESAGTEKARLLKERIQALGQEGIPHEPDIEIEYEWYQLRMISDQDRLPDVQHAVQRLFERAQREGTPSQVTRIENHLAQLAMQQQQYDEALRLLDDLQTRQRREFLFIHEAFTSHNRAAVLDELEEFRAAQVAMERAAQLHAYAGNDAGCL